MKLQNLLNFLNILNIHIDCPQHLTNSSSFRINLNEVTKLIYLSFLNILFDCLSRTNEKFFKLQKNVEELQAFQESFRSHTKIITSLTDILELLQLLKNVQELQALQESFRSHKKIFTSLADLLELLQLLKNIQELQELQESFRSHTKIFTSLIDILELLKLQKSFRTSRHFWSHLAVIQKYLQA